MLCIMQCSLCPQIIIDSRLQERNLGVLQGLTLLEAAQLQPRAYAAFRMPGPDVTLEVRLAVVYISACWTADSGAQLAADSVKALPHCLLQGGESVFQLEQRVVEAINSIVAKHPGQFPQVY